MSLKLTAKDLIEVIKACGDVGVSDFKWGNINISFNKKDREPTLSEVLDYDEEITLEEEKEIRPDDDLVLTDPDAWVMAQYKTDEVRS
jgi:hypothetical protein